MSATGQPSSKGPASDKPAKAVPSGKKELKILMLHGYTQSGHLFNAKTKALSKLLVKALAPLNLVPALIYPTGPFRLRPSDIPGFQPSSAASADVSDEDTDSWAWFRRDDNTGTYRGLEEGMKRVAETVAEAGGVDGVVGFSQGGAMAAMVASAMEPDRSSAAAAGGDLPEWVADLRAANGGRPLRFCVVYSGFIARDEELQWLYNPPVATPTQHFLGSLDTVVEESRSQALVERCRDPVVVVHPGGHYVPVAKEWAMTLVGFLRKCCEEDKKDGQGGKEASL